MILEKSGSQFSLTNKRILRWIHTEALILLQFTRKIPEQERCKSQQLLEGRKWKRGEGREALCLREAGQLHHNRQPYGEERDIRESKEARVAGFFKMERERERKVNVKVL